VRVASFQRFRQVVAGSTHTCALTEGGYPYCWGADVSGVMGDATVRETCLGRPCATRPMPVAIGFRFDSLSAGYEHSCGLRANLAYCWGRGDVGQLGAFGRMETCDDVACSRAPRLVSDSLRFSSIVARGAQTCGIAADVLWCWGDNRHAQLTGAAGVATTSRPIALSAAGAFTQVSMAGLYTCAVTRAGSVECWGANDRGRLGAPSGDATRGSIAPPVGQRFVRVTAGGTHTCALTSEGIAYCWGSDIDGRLGGRAMASCDGLPCSAEPVRVPLSVALTDVAAGGSMTCATAVDGAIYCWGGDARHAVVVAETPR